MPRRIEIGERFGKLVVKAQSGRTSSQRRTLLCQCDCGEFTHVRSDVLRRGKKSCGCSTVAQRAAATTRGKRSKFIEHITDKESVWSFAVQSEYEYHNSPGRGMEPIETVYEDGIPVHKYAPGYAEGVMPQRNVGCRE